MRMIDARGTVFSVVTVLDAPSLSRCSFMSEAAVSYFQPIIAEHDHALNACRSERKHDAYCIINTECDGKPYPVHPS